MRKIVGTRQAVSLFDHHSHICDLIYFDGPLLSLFRGDQWDWLYMWVDTNQRGTDRWLVFRTDREDLVTYLQRQASLRELLIGSAAIYSLDKKIVHDGIETSIHRQAQFVPTAEVEEYFPDADSYFDESLTRDVEATREIAPNIFSIPVKGRWFLPDIGKFSKNFTRLYSFIYCSRPQFVSNLEEKMRRYLESPWQGGYSRVNFFDALHRQIPSIHDMRVANYNYNSPGDIKIEALSSVGADVVTLVLRYLNSKASVDKDYKIIDTIIGKANLRKENLSRISDDRLIIAAEHLDSIKEKLRSIGDALELENEFGTLARMSPNTVVQAKVVISLVRQVSKLADYQSSGMLDLTRQ